MKSKPIEIMSFLEWRQIYKSKKKEQKNESGSISIKGEIGFKNGEEQAVGNHSEVPIENVHVFPNS